MKLSAAFVRRKLSTAVCAAGLVLLILCALHAGEWKGLRSWLREKQEAKQAAELEKELATRELLEPSKVIPGFASDAVLVLAYLGRKQEGTVAEWPKVAFAIGDGTLILTSAHCVSTFGDLRPQAVSPDTVVISPYYGDVFEFKILAIDREADVAVLKAPWPGHPALALASEEELAAAKEMLVAGYPPPEEKEPPYRFPREVRMEKLPVLEVNEKTPNMAITLRGTRFVAPGWSGSAMVLPETGKVAGVANILSATTTGKGVLVKRNAVGCSVRSVNALLEKHGLQEATKRRPPELKTIEDAPRAFSLAMDYVETFWNKDSDKALAVAQELASLRPESVQAHLFLAWSADIACTDAAAQQDLIAVAEANFRKAVLLGPGTAGAHVAYGNFLMHRQRYEEALAETDAALAIEPHNDLALVNRISILSKTDPAKAEQLGRELTTQHPENPHYWLWYGASLTALKRYDEALAAAQKAVELNPDGLYQGQLAGALTRVGRFDEAESLYRKMTGDCGCQACWVRYADFLLEHRLDKLDEAEKAVKAAESKEWKRVPKDDMAKLRVKLDVTRLQALEKQSPKEAEALARRLLDESPENGHYWFALAGILRTLGQHEQAVQAARKAVLLRPDLSFRPRLADTLAKAGHLDEAERTYNEMLRDYPQRPKYWFWYAKFLNEYHPERIKEAREALSKAEVETAEKSWNVLPEELRELQEKVTSTAPASQAG